MPLQLADRPPLTHFSHKFDSAWATSSEKQRQLGEEIQSLWDKQAIERAAKGPGFYARLFLVKKKNGSFKPVFNLKPLNKHIHKQSFKMATVRTVAESIRQGDWAVSLDLKDAYLHVPILKKHRKFLSFAFKGQCYQFKVLPFGLSSAPRVFTKLTRVIIIHCRKLGVRLVLYLDDSLLLAQPRERALQHRDLLLALLPDLGFIVNWEKSDLAPSKEWDFISLHWSSHTMTISLPAEKVLKLQQGAARLSELQPPSCRAVQRFLGKANFAALAVPRARMHIRAQQRALKRHYRSPRDLFAPCPLGPEGLKDLQFWRGDFPSAKSLLRPYPQATVATDASNHGWGAAWADKRLAGTWSPSEAPLHINVKEMLAVLKAITAWARDLSGLTVSLQSDNRTVVAYLTKEGGTRSPELCDLAFTVLRKCDLYTINLRPAYLPGMANLEADGLSRGKKLQEWTLQGSTVRELFRKWGGPHTDLFASREAHHLPRYYTLDRRDHRAAGHDAFLHKWSKSLYLAFPPPQLISQVLGKSHQDGTTLILIAPDWQDCPWYGELLSRIKDKPAPLPPKAVRVIQTGRTPVQAKDLHLTAWLVSGRPQHGRELGNQRQT